MTEADEIAEMSPIPDDEYEAPLFSPTKLIEKVRSIPRFGHIDSIAYAASGDDQARRDYLEGVVFVSALILLLFIVWVIMLIVLKVMGSSRVGCASGKAPTYPSLESIQAANHTLQRKGQQLEGDPAMNGNAAAGEQGGIEVNYYTQQQYIVQAAGAAEDSDVADMEQWLSEVKVIERRIRGVRIAFIFCGVVIIPMSIVLLAAGFSVLDNAFKVTQENVMATHGVISDNLQRIDSLIRSGKQAALVRDASVEELSSWCPQDADNVIVVPSDTIPSNVFSIDNGDGTSAVTILNATDGLMTTLDDLGKFIVPGALRVEESLVRARGHAEATNDTMAEISWWFYFALAFAILIDMFVLAFVVGVCLAWTYRLPKWFERLLTYGLIPFYSCLIALLWLCVSGFAFTLVLNADVCSGSPEENVVAIVHEKEIGMDPLLYQMAKYYIEGCTLDEKPEKPTILFDNFMAFLDTGLSSSEAFKEMVGSVDTLSLVQACGTGISVTMRQLSYLVASLTDVREKTMHMIEGLYCSNFNPIYSKNMYEAVCYDGVRGLAAIFATLFVITVCGLTMISLRVALHEVRNESNWLGELGLEVEKSEKGENLPEQIFVGNSRENADDPTGEEIEEEQFVDEDVGRILVDEEEIEEEQFVDEDYRRYHISVDEGEGGLHAA